MYNTPPKPNQDQKLRIKEVEKIHIKKELQIKVQTLLKELQKDNVKSAIKFLEEKPLKKQNPQIYYQIAILYQSIQKYPESIENFEYAIKYKKQCIQYHVGLSQLYYVKEKNITKSEEILIKYKQSYSSNGQIYFQLGRLYHRQQHMFAQAQMFYLEAISIIPKFMKGHYFLSKLFKMHRKFQKQKEQLQILYKLDSNNKQYKNAREINIDNLSKQDLNSNLNPNFDQNEVPIIQRKLSQGIIHLSQKNSSRGGSYKNSKNSSNGSGRKFQGFDANPDANPNVEILTQKQIKAKIKNNLKISQFGMQARNKNNSLTDLNNPTGKK